MYVGHPLVGAAAVVAVQHRGDGVDAQAVDVVALEPEQRVRDQEVAHLGAREVVDQRAPVGVEALARVGVFIESRAVELAQPVRVGREVRRHPVEQHADARGVRARDEAAESRGPAEARRRAVQADRLVAPRAVERMFGHGQQFEVGVAHLLRIWHQLIGQLGPGEEAIAVLHLAPPGAQVHLVDRDWRVERVGAAALGRRRQRCRQPRDDAGGLWAHLGLQRVGVGLERQQAAVACAQFVLVMRAAADARQEQLPHAALAAQPHRVAPAVPVVEVADDGDARGVGRPDGEAGAGHAVLDRQPRPQHLPRPQMRAFGEQPHVHLAEHRAVAVRVVERRFAAVVPAHLQPVVARRCAVARAFEEAGGVAALEAGEHSAAGRVEHGHRGRPRLEAAQLPAAVGARMCAEHGERVAVSRRADLGNLAGVQHAAADRFQ